MPLNLLEEKLAVIRPTEGIAAYEALWTRFEGFGKLADLFNRHHHDLPSQVAQAEGITAEELSQVKASIANLG